MYLVIFTQFFCDFHTVFFFAHPINFKRLVVFLYFSKTNSYFQGWFYKIPGQFQDKRHFFSNSRSFPGPMSFFQVCANPVRACLILYAIICGYMLWSWNVAHCFHPLWPWSQESVLEKMHPQQIAYFIYGSIPYLVCRYILDPCDSPTVSKSLWPWPLVSVLARSGSEHICIYFEVGILNLVWGYILGSWRVAYTPGSLWHVACT